ncbi:hypothetical protein D9615_008027 [Tricholomella constricta]|uniref:Mixed lineage kinase domain-containing protein n=1 Tax=Tricholomella constricta TaxID=117010 RepID=A0A8H5LZK6_9AGAR|nr:hypothetical protein D9615_008027 [Tricholomella constricta]
MPLRFIKVRVPRVNSQDVVHLAISATSLMRELSNLAFFPPATAAVSIVLLILQTVQGVQTNKESCLRLVRRCARILLDINDQMAGRWNAAPPTLMRNLERFQSTLTSIHEFMKILTDTTWARRFMKKTSIENAIIDYSAQLEDAAQSFQVIATLIDIHYAVASRASERDPEVTLPPPPYAVTQCTTTYPYSPIERRFYSLVVESPVETEGGVYASSTPIPGSDITVAGEPEEDSFGDDHIVSEEVLESRGFRRYHQSEIRLKGNSKLKDGWWAGVSAAEVEGRLSLIKRYEGPNEQALKAWMSDVKLLQDVFFPQMVGLSEDRSPTPFILLSNVQTRSPQALLLDTLRTDGLAACANLILHFVSRTHKPDCSSLSRLALKYQDVVDATTYIKRQRGLNDSRAQDFVGGSSFRVDGSNTVIMGLPPPRDAWFTARNYGLTTSLRMVVMDMLPKGGGIQYKREDDAEDGDTSRRISHLVALTRGLLPSDNAPITLSPRVKALIGNQDDDDIRYKERSKLDIRQLRLSNIEADAHDHVWNENGGISSHKFLVGDFGYIPKQGKDFKSFVTLGNVLKEGLAMFEIQNDTRGFQWSWDDIPIRHVEMEPFPLPCDVTCWSMAVLPNAQIDCQIMHSKVVTSVGDAWRFLLLYGKDLAAEHNIRPDELILITRAGTNQDFYIKDLSTPVHAFHRPPVYPRFGQPPQFSQNGPGFNNQLQQHRHMLPYQNNLPTIMYLITSSSPDFQPYWSHSPVAVPPSASRPDLKRGWTFKIGWSTGFINWIQLHAEDFAN